MNDKTCGNCKFRGDEIEGLDEDYEPKPLGYFLCTRINYVGDKTDLSNGDVSGAAVIDGSGYYGALCVETEFGCNKWEPST